MRVTGVQDDILVGVLRAVELPDYLVVAITEPDEGDHVTGPLLKPGVRLDVLLHRLSDGPGTVLEALVLPVVVKLRNEGFEICIEPYLIDLSFVIVVELVGNCEPVWRFEPGNHL